MMMMSMYCNNVLSTDMICSDQCSWTLAEWWLMIMMMMGRTSLISTLHEYKRTWSKQANTSCSNKLDIFATDIVKLEIFIKSSLLGRNLDISKSAVNTSLDKKTESLFGNITFILLTCPVSDTHHTNNIINTRNHSLNCSSQGSGSVQLKLTTERCYFITTTSSANQTTDSGTTTTYHHWNGFKLTSADFCDIDM